MELSILSLVRDANMVRLYTVLLYLIFGKREDIIFMIY